MNNTYFELITKMEEVAETHKLYFKYCIYDGRILLDFKTSNGEYSTCGIMVAGQEVHRIPFDRIIYQILAELKHYKLIKEVKSC
ncbi:MAG: hypothetical protein K0S34_776 [Bacillales bacterium]|jgi:hypothetical protein|nr:hypothetical protein [Bacillales bacterium]